MHQIARYASELHFEVGFCPKKLSEQPQSPQKPYDFPIEHAS
jgi:hypothetical protein